MFKKNKKSLKNPELQKKYNRSETSFCRERLKGYCKGNGLDLGYGGDPIVPNAITVDVPETNYAVGAVPLNLKGDASNLFWFKDEAMDYVYSSHLLEDFEKNKTKSVLLEWLRVLKIGGHLILYLPDEQAYRKHCKETGQEYNAAHKISDFSLNYLKDILNKFDNVVIIHENPHVEVYSFEIVVKKCKK